MDSIWDDLHLSTLRYHWQVVLASAAFCFVIFELSRVISPVNFPKTFHTFSGYDAPNWHVHIVSTMHSIVVVAGSFFIFFDDQLAHDRIFGYSPRATNIYSMSCGYFIWDVITAIRFVKHQGLPMVFHGLASFAVLILSYRPFVNYYGAFFLMYELSTIFLNFNWFMHKLGWSGTKLQLINGIVLLLTFFFARIVLGLYMSYQFWSDIHAVKHLVPTRYWVVYGSANFVTSCLNIYWMRLLVINFAKRLPRKHLATVRKGQ